MRKIQSQKGWIAVDLDCTLAEYHGDLLVVGKPIRPMLNRVKRWLKQGREVRIFTARVYEGPERSEVDLADHNWVRKQQKLINDWCRKYLGQELLVTCVKDFRMEILYDDRTIQVIPNDGRLVKKCKNH
jgi:hypothetical protein